MTKLHDPILPIFTTL